MLLAEIEKLTKDYADSYDSLAGIVTDLNQQIEELKRARMADIRRAVRLAAQRKANVVQAIKDNPGLFVKPRTYVFHGIKVGLQKEKGALVWESADDVLRLIHKHFSDRQEELIRRSEAPAKTALANLTAAELRKLGVEIVDAHDTVVVAPADSNVDKIVSALVKDAEAAVIDEPTAEAA